MGRLAPGMRHVWITEFGYETKPPDPGARSGPQDQVDFLPWAECLAARNPDVVTFSQFELRDPPLTPGAPPKATGFHTGMEFKDGRPKPSYYAFPAWLHVERHRDGRLLLFGHVRVGGPVPSVTLEWRSRRGRPWHLTGSAAAGGGPTVRDIAPEPGGVFLRTARGALGKHAQFRFLYQIGGVSRATLPTDAERAWIPTVPSGGARSLRALMSALLEAPAAVPPARPAQRELALAPYDLEAAHELRRALGVSPVMAQVLVRRGLAEPNAAARFLAADESHPPAAFAGMGAAVASILGHVRRGARITVHGDYDVDGVTSTVILLRALRDLGAQADWFIPGRREDGYGLSARTVERLAERGTALLLTVDCGITAVEEVAAARAAGLDVVITDHHAPRADGRLPAAPIVHPRVGRYPCPDLCAAGVAHKLVAALAEAAGAGPELAARDVGLVALATVADLVPLKGENRRLVREGLRALAATPSPGVRALMRAAELDPGALDARALGFRLAPRINAAGRLRRADAGVELLLTEDDARAEAIARELDAVNSERRAIERELRWAAEAQVVEQGERPAYVLAGEGWHPGVVGIVASRIAERYHRPAVLIALDGEGEGQGSGRSIPGFDLLGGLDACAGELRSHGGHRAAAGLRIAAEGVDAFRASFEAHAARVLTAEDLRARERVDAVVPGSSLGLPLAEELARLEPCGAGNPPVTLLVPGAACEDPRPMGEEGRHLRFTVRAGGARAQAVSFGCDGRLPVPAGAPCDLAVRLERREWRGAVEARLLLVAARAGEAARAPIAVLGRGAHAGGAEWLAAALAAAARGAEEDRAPGAAPAVAGAGDRPLADRRAEGPAAVLADLLGSGEPVLAVVADVARRLPALRERTGGFALCAWSDLRADPTLAEGHAHVVALDPPAGELPALPGRGRLYLAWGEPEREFAVAVATREHDLRAPLTALYRGLRDAGAAQGEPLTALLRAGADTPAAAGRQLRVLIELELAALEAGAGAVRVLPRARAELSASPTYRRAEAARARALAALAGAAAGYA